MLGVLQNAGLELFNPYGPAEVTINSHAYKCGLEDATMVSVPIGCPLQNTTGFVLDGHHRMVPIGVAGELYLGGPKVARGYIGRQDLTDQAFGSLKTLSQHGRLYKTGDRVRWLTMPATEEASVSMPKDFELC